MCMDVLYGVCVCEAYMTVTNRGQMVVLNPLDQKLQTVVRHHVDAENRTLTLWKSSPSAISPVPIPLSIVVKEMKICPQEYS